MVDVKVSDLEMHGQGTPFSRSHCKWFDVEKRSGAFLRSDLRSSFSMEMVLESNRLLVVEGNDCRSAQFFF